MDDPQVIDRLELGWITLGILISAAIYWSAVLIYMAVPRLFPAHAARHSLGERKQKLSRKRHFRLIGLTLFNQFLVTMGFFTLLVWAYTSMGGTMPIWPTSAWKVLLHLMLYLIFFDTLYFWAHRLLHTRYLFRKVHSVHHLFRTPFPYCAICVHPVEFIVAYLIPQILASVIFQFSYVETMSFLALALLHTVHDHCGYSYPWDPMRILSSQNSITHEIHHRHVNVNYSGAFTCLWDRLMGTLQLPEDEPGRTKERIGRSGNRPR